MKYQRIESSWRDAFIGVYITPEKDKLWITILPFFPIYFKRERCRLWEGNKQKGDSQNVPKR